MKPEELISKIVLDRDSKELGLIERIEKMPHLLTKKLVPYLIIRVKISWRKKINIPIDIAQISKVENNKVWLKITKETFTQEVERQIIISQQRDQYRNFVNPNSKWFATSNIDRRPKRKE